MTEAWLHGDVFVVVVVAVAFFAASIERNRHKAEVKRMLADMAEARQAARVGQELEGLLGRCAFVSVEIDGGLYYVKYRLLGGAWLQGVRGASLLSAMVAARLQSEPAQAAQPGVVDEPDTDPRPERRPHIA